MKMKIMLGLVVGMMVGADCVQAQTWNGLGSKIWTDADSDDFSPQYDNGDTATFTTTGNGTVTIDPGGVTPGAIIVNSGTYTFTGGSIGGTGSVTKTGSGDLTLLSSHSFSGGIFLNQGKLILTTGSTAASLGDSANVITFTGNSTLNASNFDPTLSQGVSVNGVTASFFGNAGRTFTINGALTGSGSVSIGGSGTKMYCYFNSISNTFSGNLSVSGGAGDHQLRMNSLADTSGSSLRLGNDTFSVYFTYGSGAVVPLVLSNRKIQLGGTTGGGGIYNNATNVNSTVTINTDLWITGVGDKTLTLNGSNTGTNTFAGAITNGTGSVISLTKSGTGRWILSGENSFSGNTTVSDGTLVLAGSNCLTDTNALYIASGKKVQLEAGVKEKIGKLFLNGVQQADGEWGAIGNSKADNTSAYLLGSGLLYVNVDPPPIGTIILLR
jgi:fibronectin-binding autotransporter adhesin